MRPRRRTPRRRDAPRWEPEEWEPATQVLLTRDHGCPVCNLPLTDAMERHHRQRRRAGGDRYANLIGLHPACHTRVHAHPVEARTNGWMVPTWEDPAQVPMRHGSSWFLLDDDGARLRVDPPDP